MNVATYVLLGFALFFAVMAGLYYRSGQRYLSGYPEKRWQRMLP